MKRTKRGPKVRYTHWEYGYSVNYGSLVIGRVWGGTSGWHAMMLSGRMVAECVSTRRAAAEAMLRRAGL
jgi:hypothetical protein